MGVRVLSGMTAASVALALPAVGLAAAPMIDPHGAVTASRGPVLDPLPAPRTTHVFVGPRRIGTHTSVLVRFRQPMTTGYSGDERAIEALEISGPSRPVCIGSRRILLGAAPAGTMMRHRLRPRWLGGRWCTGLYRGRLTYQVEPACGPGPIRAMPAAPTPIACPMFIMAPRTIATFHFRVTAR
ncbi:MAG TPA: hypothetical protein VKV21_03640 [Solirubrobacteraceae bacterium]|nr:hypothetical protein [Solirubrobacteraceae bacterium]